MSNFIKELRIKNKLTQEELAKQLNTDRSTISKYENGLLNIPTDIIKKISNIYNIEVEDIINSQYDKIDKSIKDKKKYNRTKWVLISIIITLIIVLSYFLYFFINTYKKSSYYNIVIDNNEIEAKSSYMLLTPTFIKIYIGNVIYKEEIDTLELNYTTDDKMKLIKRQQGSAIEVIDYIDYNEYINFNDIEYIKNNLSLRMYLRNGQIIDSKLSLSQIYTNSKLIKPKIQSGFIINEENDEYEEYRQTNHYQINKKIKYDGKEYEVYTGITNNGLDKEYSMCIIINKKESITFYIKYNKDYQYEGVDYDIDHKFVFSYNYRINKCLGTCDMNMIKYYENIRDLALKEIEKEDK